jgi:hydrogenase maturation protease
MSEDRILVMGVGNPLMRDEGIGPRVIELLRSTYTFPANVEVVDAGTMGLMILDLLRGIDRLIVVDAVKDTGHEPGTVLLLSPEDLAENQVMHSLHDMRLVDVLQNAALLDCTPSTVVVGVQIESIVQWVVELSPRAEAALPVAVVAVLDQLKAAGVEPTPHEGTDVDARIIEALRTFAPMLESDAAPLPTSPADDEV